MTSAAKPSGSPPRLYHASSSYYSMIARLALVERGVEFEGVPIDIHRKKQQFEPWYVNLNPNMTVPTLVLPDRTLADSHDILRHAFGLARDADEATRRWVDLQYGFAVEELTFGWFLSWNPLARRFIPKVLASTEQQLRALADEHRDLADRYRKRAEVFAARARAFDPDAAASLYPARRKQALDLLDALDAELSDGRQTLVPGGYGQADVVWTVFVARMRFVRMGDEVDRRPALSRYAQAMFARPSFERADVWATIDPLKLLKQMF